jgi:hypothetical protein
MRGLHLCGILLTSEKDKPLWKWTKKNAQLSVKSMYKTRAIMVLIDPLGICGEKKLP